MKHISKLIALAFVAVGFSTQVNAQATASASASATIVSPISITKTVDLNFGNVAASASAGTVVISPAGVRSTTGGVSLPATAGTVAAVTAPRPRTFGYSIEAYTVGTDDQRDRSKLLSPLLMVVIPKLPFVNNRTPVDCTPKT